MTASMFNLLPPRSQLRMALSEGLLVAHRWGQDGLIHLYQLADGRKGYFAEVGHEIVRNRLAVLHSFGRVDATQNYCWHFQAPQ